MSFIYQNKYLVEELIKIGTSNLERYGANKDPAYGLANKLIINLQRQIDPESAPLNPNIVVDGLPIVLDVKNPTQGVENYTDNFQSSSVKLQASIIDDETKFKDWIKKLLVKTGEIQALANDPKIDICLVVHSLYKRAQYLSNMASTRDTEVPGYSKAVKLYLDNIVKIGQTFRGKDGQSCSVTSPGVTSTSSGTPTTSGTSAGSASSGTVPSGATSSTGGEASLNLVQKGYIKSIFLNLPLDITSIHTDKILFFSNNFNLLNQTSEDKFLSSGIANSINNMISSNEILMQYPNKTIHLEQTMSYIYGLLKNGINSAKTYLDNLCQLIIYTQSMLDLFMSSWSHGLTLDQNNKLNTQIRIAGQNLDSINEMIRNYLTDVKNSRRQ